MNLITNLVILSSLLSGLKPSTEYEPFQKVFLILTDKLLQSQIMDPNNRDYGALISPSTNPQPNPRHSRAAEAVYPMALAYELTHKKLYIERALLLGRWLINIQKPGGSWGEEWPHHDGWEGTTVDQLLSLAAAYPILNSHMTRDDDLMWQQAIHKAAHYVNKDLLNGNLNYQITAASALLLAHKAITDAPSAWLTRAEELARDSFNHINEDGLLVGESHSVDAGYNLAQSLGYMALYGVLKKDNNILVEASPT